MPNELILIILGCLMMGVGFYISEWRRKKQEERQARLNSIKFTNSQSKLTERQDEANIIRLVFFLIKTYYMLCQVKN